jgi:F-type H+-transporting ATPase subunit epsilon
VSARITLELVTPERLAFNGEVDFVVLPAWEGEMGVLPGHVPFLVQLKPGEVRYTDRGQTACFAVSGGFAEVTRGRVALFAETAEMSDAIDEERARQALERAKAELQKRNLDSLTLAQAHFALRRAQVRLQVAQYRKGRRG